MTQHTPGPWTCTLNNHDDGSTDIVIMAHDQDGTELGSILEGSVTTSYDPALDKANARLLEAAPDLLEAAMMTLDLLSELTTDEFSRGGDRVACSLLARAIALATDPTDTEEAANRKGGQSR